LPCRRRFLAAAVLVPFLHLGQSWVLGQQNSAPDVTVQTPPQSAKPEPAEASPSESQIAPATPALQPTLPNFSSCPLTELRHVVRELAHLKPDEDQSRLSVLLEQIGTKTVEIANKTPNLISHESVVSEQANSETRRKYSFLVLQHALDSKSVVFDEYRVDLKTGRDMETDFENTPTPASETSSPLPIRVASTPTLTQGFVSQWLFFYPPNQAESNFRYLGEQDIGDHYTLVVAFAQKPGSVRLPATFTTGGQKFPIFMQGVAWVDSSDFRIVRLRTDLLFVPLEISLRQLTADTRFTGVRLAGVASPLWLPREVRVTARIATTRLHEVHTYSDYRVFRVRSKIVPK
jgi:hypothetical protein